LRGGAFGPIAVARIDRIPVRLGCASGVGIGSKIVWGNDATSVASPGSTQLVCAFGPHESDPASQTPRVTDHKLAIPPQFSSGTPLMGVPQRTRGSPAKSSGPNSSGDPGARHIGKSAHPRSS
jgi:hypothetical protein